MGEYMMGYDEMLGEDEDDDGDLLGRKVFRGARRGGVVVRKAPLALPTRAKTGPQLIRAPMGWGTASWTGAADAGDRLLEVEPQEGFRGARLVIDTLITGGTSLGLGLVRRIDVGSLSQSPSATQPMPMAMFRPDSTASFIDLQLAEKGTKMLLTLGITASPGAGVTFTAVAGVYGYWVR